MVYTEGDTQYYRFIVLGEMEGRRREGGGRKKGI